MTWKRFESKWAWPLAGGMSVGLVVVGVSCGGDDTPPAVVTVVGAGGQGGDTAGGTAGSVGTAGSTGSAGSTTGGSAGTGTGGSTGSAGSTGSGGSGGTDGGGSGGTGGSGVSDAGAAAQRRAAANLEGRSGVVLSGSGVFTQPATGGAVTLVVTIQLDPRDASSLHGIHLHQVPDCGPDDGGATQAGAHWNLPDGGGGHGLPDGAMHHVGDIGNIAVGANGRGTLTFTTNDWAIGTSTVNDVVGRALVIHARTDDGTDGSVEGGPGNSGARIGCGVIQLIVGPPDGGPSVDAGRDGAVPDARADARDASDGRDPDCPSTAPMPGSSCADAGAGTICQYGNMNQRTCACDQMGTWVCFP